MRAYPIARSELQAMLLDANKPAPVHLAKAAVSYETTPEGVKVHFHDGTSDFAWMDLAPSIRSSPRPVRAPCVDCECFWSSS